MKLSLPPLAAVLVPAALVFSLGGCGAQKPAQSHQQVLDACLYSALSEYPTLPASEVALDVAPGCAKLPASDRQQLRTLVNSFMQAAQAKS